MTHTTPDESQRIPRETTTCQFPPMSLASHGEDDDWNLSILDLKVPILGFCFGHQEIAKHYGGEVIHGGREWGAATHPSRPMKKVEVVATGRKQIG